MFFIALAASLILITIVVYVVIDTRKWLDRESKRYLSFVLFTWTLSVFVVFITPSEYRTAFAAVYAATLASFGWVITNHQARVYNRILYTNTQIDHYRNDSGFQRCVLQIRKQYIDQPLITPVEVEQIRAEYLKSSSYGQDINQTPIMHSIVHVLNFFERIAYLYQNDLVDQRLFYRHFNIILGKQIIRMQHVIRQIRSEDSGKKPYNDLRDLLLAWYDFDIDGKNVLTNSDIELKRFKHFYEKQ